MAINISTIRINATKRRVWDTLTKPELVKLWQYGSDLETSWIVGTSIKIRTVWEDKVFEQWGQVLDIRQDELIRYSLFAPRPGLEDKPENYFIMSYVLKEDEGQTTVDIIQEDNRPNAVQEKPKGEENPFLQFLKKIAESD